MRAPATLCTLCQLARLVQLALQIGGLGLAPALLSLQVLHLLLHLGALAQRLLTAQRITAQHSVM
jgi:hypothetical protein